MDCSVRPTRHAGISLISTTDFFYPLVDDPYAQGQIGCANVLSDMYAMGVVNIDAVLMLLAASTEMDPGSRRIVTEKMIEGFNDLAREAGTEVTGGQSVLNPWPIIGGVAESVCSADEFINPEDAVAGDVVILTKALGTQIAVNMLEWIQNGSLAGKLGDAITEAKALEAFEISKASMRRLNRNGARLMHKYGCHAGTDVTGFGILGHAINLAKNQKLPVDLVLHTLPVIAGCVAAEDKLNGFFKLRAGYSAETSGGLLLCVPAANAAAFCKELEDLDGWPAWVIGDVVEGARTATIAAGVKVVEVGMRA